MMPSLAWLAALLLACSASPDVPPAPTPASDAVAAEGQRFDPPVDVSEIPTGSWMCDMGTVHYAAGEAHDGTCPVCGMQLTQKK